MCPLCLAHRSIEDPGLQKKRSHQSQHIRSQRPIPLHMNVCIICNIARCTAKNTWRSNIPHILSILIGSERSEQLSWWRVARLHSFRPQFEFAHMISVCVFDTAHRGECWWAWVPACSSGFNFRISAFKTIAFIQLKSVQSERKCNKIIVHTTYYFCQRVRACVCAHRICLCFIYRASYMSSYCGTWNKNTRYNNDCGVCDCLKAPVGADMQYGLALQLQSHTHSQYDVKWIEVSIKCCIFC